MSGNMKSSSNHLCKHLCRRCTLQDLEVSTKVWRCERFLLNIPTGWDGCNTVIFTGYLGSFNVSTSTGWWGTTLSFFILAAGDALISEALCCWRIPSALPCFFRALHCDFLQGKLRPSSPLARPDNRTRAHHQQKINNMLIFRHHSYLRYLRHCSRWTLGSCIVTRQGANSVGMSLQVGWHSSLIRCMHMETMTPS